MRAVTEILETYQAITRPVAFDIVRKLGELMRLPAGTEILFPGAADQGSQSGSTLNYQGAPTKFPGSSKIDVTIAESDEGAIPLSENALQNNAPVVFDDPHLGVQLRAIYAQTTLTFTFNIRCQARNEADKLRNEFRLRTSMGRGQILHTLNYHYGMPEDIQELLTQIWTMREAVAGYGQDFATWFTTYGSQRLRKLNESERYAFAERQVGALGIFDFQIAPELPEKSEQNGTYNFPIQYKVTFDKPIGMRVDYPLVVHNQMLPAKFYGNPFPGGKTLEDPYATKLYSDTFSKSLRELYLNRRLAPRPIGGLRIPHYDDWMPNGVPLNTSTVFVAMLAVNEDDLGEVIDLTDLEGVVIDGDVRQYMAGEGRLLGQLNLSAIHVALYKNGQWMGDEAIMISNTLKVRSTKPLCLRDRYHLRVAVLDDLTKLPDGARLNLRKHGLACQKILLTLQQRMSNGTFVPKLVAGGIMPDKYLLACADRINRYKRGYYHGYEHQMLTVGNFLISTHRMSDHAPDESTGGSSSADSPPTSDHYESVVPGHCEPAAGCEQPRPF